MILPFLGVSQQEVLDGVYVREHHPSKKITPLDKRKDFHWTTQSLSRDTNFVYSKPSKIEGFTNINLQGFLNKWPGRGGIEERILSRTSEPNTKLYTSPKNEIIGNPTLGTVKGGVRRYSEIHSNFYIKNHEVTNAEYREFVNYVRDSIILTTLAEEEPDKFYVAEGEHEQRLKWPKSLQPYLDDFDYADVLSDLYFQVYPENVYEKKHFDTRKLNYVIKDINGNRNVINIYPDTLSWVHDMPFSWNEPLAQMYFWHPVYDTYPVVGVSYNQVLAYLHWFRKKGIKELDKKGIEYEIGLPTPQEWELTTSIGYTKPMFVNPDADRLDEFMYFYDQNIAFDLDLARSKKKVLGTWTDKTEMVTLNDHINPYTRTPGSFIMDRSIHTISVNWDDAKHMPGYFSMNHEIFNLGNNVSEWMDASYSDYKGFTETLSETLKGSLYKSLNAIGKQLDKRLATFDDNYQLAIGANWLDEHYEMIFGAPLKGIYTKTFADPDSGYSTLGFRYVIRLKKDYKEDQVKTYHWVNKANVFDSLYNAGYELVDDSTNTELWEKKKIVFHLKEKLPPIYEAVYDRTKPSLDQKTDEFLINHFNNIWELINRGGDVVAFYTPIPGLSPNVVFEFSIKYVNDRTLELTRW